MQLEHRFGPFSEGQVPEKCGHYFPNVISIFNVRVISTDRRKERRLVIFHCRYCEYYDKYTESKSKSYDEVIGDSLSVVEDKIIQLTEKYEKLKDYDLIRKRQFDRFEKLYNS